MKKGPGALLPGLLLSELLRLRRAHGGAGCAAVFCPRALYPPLWDCAHASHFQKNTL